MPPLPPIHTVRRRSEARPLLAAAVLGALLGVTPAVAGGSRCERCLVGSVRCGEPVTAEFPGAECEQPDATRVEYWRLDVGAGAVVTIELSSDQFDTVLTLTDDLCLVLAENDDCRDSTNSCTSYLAAPGTYYIGVSSFFPRQKGTYELNVRCRPFDLCGCDVGSVACGETIVAGFPRSGCRAQEDIPVDVLRFALPQPGRVSIRLESTRFDPVLRLIDDRCRVFAENDDCIGANSCLEMELDAGQYAIGVSSFDGIGSGGFSLTVECPDLDLCRECNRGVASCGAALGGALTDESCQVSGGQPVEFWNVEVAGAGRVLLAVDSDDFDPVLSVFDEGDTLVASNDDCPLGGLGACVDAWLEPGTYCVAVRSFFAEGRGAYSLGVDCRDRGGQIAGDCNQDGTVDISDGICVLGHLFLGEPARLPCGDGSTAHPANRALLDVNRDDEIDLTDAIAVFGFLFLGVGVEGIDGDCRAIVECQEACAR